ncbi:MAG: hypothetical protein PHO56_03040 [Patescibacteria group bacterium]|nr:hypothetical protein [Patescibacteria group bacterium]
MKKSVWLIPLSFCLFFVLLSGAQAAGLGDAFSNSTLCAAAGNCGNTGASLYQIIGAIIQTLLGLLGVIFIVLLVYGGFTWMTAEGEEAKVEKAQTIIRNAVIGLIIIVSAYAISYFVISALNKAALG